MIKLDIEKYCQNCPDFEIDIDEVVYRDLDTRLPCHMSFIIKCKHRDKCASKMAYLTDEFNKLKEGTDKFGP